MIPSSVRRSRLSLIASGSLAAVLAFTGIAVSAASAQDGAEAVEATPPEAYAPEWTDGEIANLAGMITGSWRSDAPVSDGVDGVRLVANIGPVPIEGLSNTLYAEFAREDDLDDPYYQAVFSIFRAGSQLRLRTYEFRLPVRNRGALVAGWAAPELFPDITLDEHLLARMDIELSPSADGYSGASPHPYPTSRGGAMEMRSEFAISPSAAAWTDRGYNAQGQIVWGPPAGQRTMFSRFESPIEVTRMDGGLVMVDYNNGKTDKVHEDGDGLDLHYAGWIPSTHLFQTSRDTGRSFRVPSLPVPGGLIQGWNLGVPGIAEGETRRLFIPSDLGYGERGQPQGGIPGNATLYFRVDCMFVVKASADPAGIGPQPDGE